MKNYHSSKSLRKVIKIILPPVIFLLISIFANRSMLNTPGALGLRDDWSISYYPVQNQIIGTRFLTSWLNGVVLYRNLGEIPGIIFGFFSKSFGFDGGDLSKLMIISTISLAGYSMYLLSKYLKYDLFPSLMSGLFYMSVPIVFNAVVSGYLVFLLSFALLPLLIRQLFELCNSDNRIVRNTIICSFLFRLILSQDNYLHIVSTFVFIFLFVDLVSSRNISQSFRRIAKIFFVYIITLLLSAQFVLLLLSQIGQTAKTITENAINWNTYISPKMYLAYLLDGAGYKYYLASIPLPFVSVFISAKYALIALIGMGIFGKKNPIIIKTLCLTIVISLLLFKGVNPPFGFLNEFIYQKFTFYIAAFRNIQYITVLTSLSFSILLSSFLQSFKSKIIYIGTTVLVLYGMYPFISGNYNYGVQTYVLNTGYQYLLNDLTNNESTGKIFWLPASQPMSYQDSKFAGNDPLMFGNPKYYIGNNPSNQVEKALFEKIYEPDNYEESRVLMNFLGIENIVMRDDFKSRLPMFIGKSMDKWTNELIHASLASMSATLTLEKRYSNELSLYQNKTAKPIIYLSSNPYLSEDSLDIIVKDLSKKNNYDSFIQLRDNVFDNSLLSDLIKEDNISFVKVNPTLYRVNINKASGKYLLINSENYDKGWKLYIHSKSDSRSSQVQPSNWFRKDYLPENEHILVNGYANGWIINSDDLLRQLKENNPDYLSENLYIEIEFQPQSYYFVGLIISVLVMTGSLIYLFVDYLKRKNE
ncbi:MAG TPA: hypothetical protein PLI45_01800 [Candidatus Woesebacteria bacterium]|nr:hypothetical protein [Candidatus Woesebacteria bacterium]